MFYSKSTGGFYEAAIHGDKIPADAVEITVDEHALLIEGQGQGKLIQADSTGHPVLVDQLALTPFQTRDTKLAEFKTKSDLITFSVREEYPTDEVLSWSKQELEARAYLADDSAPTPLLSAIAENRNIPLDLLAQKVVEKADVYAGFTGQIFGIRQALEDRLLAIDLDASDAVEQINAIVWPES